MKIFIYIVLVLFCSCENIDKIPFIPSDLSPPPFVALNIIDTHSISIESDESIYFKSESYYSRENLIIKEVNKKENSLIVTLSQEMVPGFEYCSEFRIEDENGNSLSFISKFYGFNPNIPKLVINEFIVKGTKTNPDKIELFVINGGNMAGVTLFNGSKNNYDYSFTFPQMEVKTGEYIVVRSTSDKYNSECIEIDDLSIENDSKFIEDVRDIRIDNFKLSSTNGVIGLYSEPYGYILDAVVYTKNYNDESKNYRNFGLSKTMNRVDEIAEDHGWLGKYDLIFPDDSIYIGNSTTTRSLNRTDHYDSDKNDDWHTVATSNATFGYENSLNYY